MRYPKKILPAMTKEDYKKKRDAILARTDVSDLQQRMALLSLNEKYKADQEYHKPDATGFSQADRDGAKYYRDNLIWRACGYGMTKNEADASDNQKLALFIARKQQEKRPFLYDESELGSPDFEKHDGTDYR